MREAYDKTEMEYDEKEEELKSALRTCGIPIHILRFIEGRLRNGASMNWRVLPMGRVFPIYTSVLPKSAISNHNAPSIKIVNSVEQSLVMRIAHRFVYAKGRGALYHHLLTPHLISLQPSATAVPGRCTSGPLTPY